MISITIIDSGVKAMLKLLPKQAGRAAEMALDQTAREIKTKVREAMPRVFKNPTPYTLNSLKLTPTKGHNMQASVWFKDPERMGQHYLVPQVEGGKRKLKGFERGLGALQYVPGKGVALNQYGNMSAGKIRQILSVLGRAERAAGYSANMTTRSRGKGKQRDYVWIVQRRGRLLPGIYERYANGEEISRGDRRRLGITGATAYQYGRRYGQFQSIARARGLRPVIIEGRTGKAVKPLLDFYGIAKRIHDRQFTGLFWREFDRQVEKSMPK